MSEVTAANGIRVVVGSEVPAGPPRGSWARDAQPLLLWFPPGGEIIVICLSSHYFMSLCARLILFNRIFTLNSMISGNIFYLDSLIFRGFSYKFMEKIYITNHLVTFGTRCFLLGFLLFGLFSVWIKVVLKLEFKSLVIP